MKTSSVQSRIIRTTASMLMLTLQLSLNPLIGELWACEAGPNCPHASPAGTTQEQMSEPVADNTGGHMDHQNSLVLMMQAQTTPTVLSAEQIAGQLRKAEMRAARRAAEAAARIARRAPRPPAASAPVITTPDGATAVPDVSVDHNEGVVVELLVKGSNLDITVEGLQSDVGIYSARDNGNGTTTVTFVFVHLQNPDEAVINAITLKATDRNTKQSASKTFNVVCECLDHDHDVDDPDGIMMPEMTEALIQVGNPDTIIESGIYLSSQLNIAAGARVQIAAGAALVIDSDISVETIHVEDGGVLMFAPGVKTNLSVKTMYVEGTLQMGTASQPVTATVTFTGTVDTILDPFEIGLGLITGHHALVSIYGYETTAAIDMPAIIPIGAVSFVLSALPAGWKVGDQLLFPDVTTIERSAIDSNEIVTITGFGTDSVTGAVTVSWDKALVYDHNLPPQAAAETGLVNQVVNLSRSVSFRSADPSNILSRGHIMFMGAATFAYAAVDGLGRTTADPLGNMTTAADGTRTAGANQAGRYAVHFHRVSLDTLSTVEGGVVQNYMKWGYVNHSSNVDFTGNVAFTGQGAAYVGEAGNEIGTWSGNFGANVMAPVRVSQPSVEGTFGLESVYWLQGGGIRVIDNFAVDAPSAIQFFPRALNGADGTAVRIRFEDLTPEDQALLIAARIANRQPVPTAGSFVSVPVVPLYVDGMKAINVGTAFKSWFTRGPLTGTTLVNFTVWGGGGDTNYTNSMVLRDWTVVGNGVLPNTRASGIGFNLSTDNPNVTLENVTVKGFDTGVVLSGIGNATITASRFKNNVNIRIPQSTASPDGSSSPRLVQIDATVAFEFLDNRWMSLIKLKPGKEAPPLPAQANISIEPFNAGNINRFFTPMFESDRILIGGKQVYQPDQAPNYVPFPAGRYTNIYPGLIGLTNQQIWNRYHLATRGALLPAGAAFDPALGLIVGPTDTSPVWALGAHARDGGAIPLVTNIKYGFNGVAYKKFFSTPIALTPGQWTPIRFEQVDPATGILHWTTSFIYKNVGGAVIK